MPTNVRALWFVISLVSIIDVVWLHLVRMSVDPKALSTSLLPLLLSLLLTGIYTWIRPNYRIASLAHTLTALITFMIVGIIFSYLLVTLDRPLVDTYLVAADHALGLDWLKMYMWIADRPVLRIFLRILYLSVIFQIFFLLFVFNFQGKVHRSWELVWLFVISGLACNLVSAMWSASGAFGFFHVNLQESYLKEFMSLRDGTMKVIGANPVQGVVQFPSFHLAMAVLVCYAARGTRILFPVLIIINVLVLIATPPIGGHHFADLWGGLIIALMTIWLVKHICDTRTMLPMP
jgi:hypothetical protein